MTAPGYTACGKQVLKDGAEFAQAASPEAADLIVFALNFRHPNQLERDVIATGLRATAVLHTDIAAKMTEPRQGQTRKTFLDAASLMLRAAKELSA
jgi:hypothetical protein